MNLFPQFNEKGEIDNSLEQTDFKDFNDLDLATHTTMEPVGIDGNTDNPQERVLMPFDTNISNRLVVKDNQSSIVPKLIDVQSYHHHQMNQLRATWAQSFTT